MKIKNILINLGVGVFLIIFFVISAWSDYTWSDRYLALKGDDFLVFSKQNNYVEPIYFYSIFKPPITKIGMIEKSSLLKIEEGVFWVKQIWAIKKIGGGVNEEVFQYLLDCKNKKEGWLKDKSKNILNPLEIKLGLINENEIEWTSFDKYEAKYSGSSKMKEDKCILINQYFKNHK